MNTKYSIICVPVLLYTDSFSNSTHKNKSNKILFHESPLLGKEREEEVVNQDSLRQKTMVHLKYRTQLIAENSLTLDLMTNQKGQYTTHTRLQSPTHPRFQSCDSP